LPAGHQGLPGPVRGQGRIRAVIRPAVARSRRLYPGWPGR
jgi:hypothetical protein